MAPSSKLTQKGYIARRVLLSSLAVVGLLISAYLSWVHYAGVAPVCVGGSGGCQSVQTSSYATIFGVPVAVIGLVGYSGLLFSAWLRGEGGIYLGFLVALVGALFSVYLTYLEVFVIHAVCEWCVASAALMVAALICTSFGAWRKHPKHTAYSPTSSAMGTLRSSDDAHGPCSDDIFLPMRRIPMLLLLCVVMLAAIFFVVGCTDGRSQGAQGSASHTKSDYVELALHPEYNSGVSCTVSLEDTSGGVLVKLNLRNLPKPNTFYLAHIHAGTCA